MLGVVYLFSQSSAIEILFLKQTIFLHIEGIEEKYGLPAIIFAKF